MLATRAAAVLCGALMGWSCASQSGTELEPADGGEAVGSSAGGFGASSSGATSGSSTGPGTGIATLCGDPVCPPLPGEDASTDDGSGEASADGSMADGAPADGSRPDSGGEGGSPDSEAVGDSASCESGVPLGCSCPTSGDGDCVCACFSMPECPTSFQADLPSSCTAAGSSCMNCLGGEAGIICTCAGSDDGGAQWLCTPTEEACTGGTFHVFRPCVSAAS